MTTLLPIVERVDNFRVHLAEEPLAPFYIHVPPRTGDATIGFLRDAVLDALEKYNGELLASGGQPIWNIVVIRPQDVENFGVRAGKVGSKMVGFSDFLNTSEQRSQAIQLMCEKWHNERRPFEDLIAGRMWRDELYPIYQTPFILDRATIAFEMERAATPLFGVITYGVHLTLYTQDYRVWVPRRAKTKQTFGGMLDNTVAGGIPNGYTPMQCIIKECEEEASLAEHVMTPHIKQAGAVTYFYRFVIVHPVSPANYYPALLRTSKGWLQPEVQYVFDLLIPSGHESDPEFIPKPFDGEVESFELLSLDVIREKMLAGEFKPNCALVMLDFMIRHGKVTYDNEPRLLEILSKLHQTFGYTD